MKTCTKNQNGKEITWQEYEENDHVFVNGQAGIIKFDSAENCLRVFLPASIKPLEIMGSFAVGQWRDKWSEVSVKEANFWLAHPESSKFLLETAKTEQEKNRYELKILPNTTNARVDYEAWVNAFHVVYSRS